MNENQKYTFEKILYCEMCNADVEKNNLLGQRLSKSQGYNPKKASGVSVSVFKCNNCGLIYSNPLPVPESVLDHYGIEPEEYSWKEDYFIDDPKYFESQISSVKKLLNFQKGMKALDIGSGLGKAMKALLNSDFDAHGLEPSVQFRERSIEWLKIPENRILLSDVETAEYPAESFEFITCGAVFEHFYHPLFVLSKLSKWLKKDGIIHIEVPSSDWLIPKFMNFYYKLRGTNYVTNLSPMHAPFHLYEFDKKSFEEACKRNNLKVVEIKYDVCTLFFVPKLLKPLFRKYMEKTNKGMQLTVYLKKI